MAGLERWRHHDAANRVSAVASEVRRVSVRGIEMEVQDVGRGERPFVLVHGYTGSRDDFREAMPRLAALGRTLAVDQRGHGGSTNTGDASHYTLDGLAADLEAALTALDVGTCDLLGHSMGGMVALRFALAHPERVLSLVLMDTAARPFRLMPPTVLEGARAVIEARGMEGLFEVMRAGDRPRAEASHRFEETLGSDRYWDRIGAKLRQMDPAAFVTLGGAQLEGVLERLPEIRCPTLVLVGAQDLPFIDAADELARGIPGAIQVTIPDAAHSPQHENPDAWLAAVSDHLARVRARGRP